MSDNQSNVETEENLVEIGSYIGTSIPGLQRGTRLAMKDGFAVRAKELAPVPYAGELNIDEGINLSDQKP